MPLTAEWGGFLGRAVEEMQPYFHQCHRCGQWVCGQVCWNTQRGLCTTCAPKLDQEIAGLQAAAAMTVGEAAVFSGVSGGEPAEIRVYDDALLVIGAASAERVSFSFVGAVRVQDYAVTVEVTGQEPVVVSRLGRRTDELAALLERRLAEARGRTAAFLGSLLPGLDPMTLRMAAGLLRDGVAGPARTLDALHPGLAGALLRLATLPARRDVVAELAGRTDLAIGFKQLASVRLAAGVTPWRDHAAAPHIGSHESPGASAP